MGKYQYKIIKCRLKTGGKSAEKIKEEYQGQGLEASDIENMQKAFEILDGMVLELYLCEYDNCKEYNLYSWKEEDDRQMMKAIYHLEQVHPYSRYKNDFNGFKDAWEKGEYEAEAILSFDPEVVEEIKVLH